MNLSLILALSRRQCAILSLFLTPPEIIPIEPSRMNFAMLPASIPSSKTPLVQSPTCKFLPKDTKIDRLPPVVNAFRLKRFLKPSFPSHRNVRGWGPKIHLNCARYNRLLDSISTARAGDVDQASLGTPPWKPLSKSAYPPIKPMNYYFRRERGFVTQSIACNSWCHKSDGRKN